MKKSPYQELLYLPHPEPQNHPRMSRQNRAAQFAPFAALTGFDAAIAETGRQTQELFFLEESEICILDNRLRYLSEHLEERISVHLCYYVPDTKKSGGHYNDYWGAIRKIDENEKIVITEDNLVIPFTALRYIDLITDTGTEP